MEFENIGHSLQITNTMHLFVTLTCLNVLVYDFVPGKV
jgi:hypothetical protein